MTSAKGDQDARKQAEWAARREADRELVAASLGGDRDAFGELFTQYRDKVYGVVYGYVRNREVALDLTQEAFVKAFQKLSSFKGTASFFTWITQIAINLAIDRGRKQKRRRTIILEEHHRPERHIAAATPPDAPSRGVLDRELRGRYTDALAQLSEKHRTVFVLHTVEELAYKEIADVLQVSIGTVMSRLHYARKRLQGLLGDYLHHPREIR